MTPLVLLHGALASGTQLRPLADALHRPDARTPDLDGHGARAAAPHELAAFVDTALAGDEPVDLVGYSLGGYVALAAAIARPDRVRRVVTIATKLAWTPEVAAAETRRLDPDRLAERAPAFVADLAERHPGPGWRTVLAHTAAFLTGLGTAPPLALERVGCPVLLLVGDADAMVTRAECADAARRIPAARLEVLPDTPHAYERMAVAPLAERIGAFLG
ncbi:MAG TPA: alpha/beta fold hydrolase [Mycobacteriales bacterium]